MDAGEGNKERALAGVDGWTTRCITVVRGEEVFLAELRGSI
jgi:hypothetical protein